MTHAPDGATTPTVRLIYRSRLRLSPEARRAGLGEIFSTARSNNRHRGITGAMLVWEQQVVQALEGEESLVRGLFETISLDPRHERVTLVTVESAAPVFARWSMARVTDDDEPDIPLLMNRDKGGISPAAPRETTPEQDAVLDDMRTLVRAGSQPA